VILTDAQLERYARHIVLKEVGGAGQLRLLSSRVAVIGAGGIGSPVVQYLAAAGVGTLRIIDDDRVSLSNLQRQTLYGSADEGAGKVERAAKAVAALNPDVTVEAVAARIGPDNADAILAGADAVVDGSDSFATRLVVSDSSVRLRVPLVSASVAQFEGQIGVYRGWEAGQACYRCLVGSDPDLPEVSCADQGVMGALAGVMGSLGALEALRCLAPFGEDMAGKLLRVDALTMRFRTARVLKDPKCPACGG
jgi:molybdopterin/thiamine biosynthesis adenylyltransferase